jgi:hypothetical protein
VVDPASEFDGDVAVALVKVVVVGSGLGRGEDGVVLGGGAAGVVVSMLEDDVGAVDIL